MIDKDIINKLPDRVKDTASKMIDAIDSKNREGYGDAANMFDIIYNTTQFELNVMQSFAKYILPKAQAAGVVNAPAAQPQPTPAPAPISDQKSDKKKR